MIVTQTGMSVTAGTDSQGRDKTNVTCSMYASLRDAEVFQATERQGSRRTMQVNRILVKTNAYGNGRDEYVLHGVNIKKDGTLGQQDMTISQYGGAAAAIPFAIKDELDHQMAKVRAALTAEILSYLSAS